MKLGRKISGGKIIKSHKKKKYERLGQARIVKLAEEPKKKITRVRGGNEKVYLLRGTTVNVTDGKKKKTVKITNVVATPSNRFLARQNIITKGTILETELGNVQVTNRPTQEGMINGILVVE